MSGEIKTVTVDIRDGERIGSQAFAADSWDADGENRLTISRQITHEMDVSEHRVVAEFAPGAWLSVRTADALAPVRDSTATALGIAKRALGEILREIRHPGDPAANRTLDKVRDLADEALQEIFAETEG